MKLTAALFATFAASASAAPICNPEECINWDCNAKGLDAPDWCKCWKEGIKYPGCTSFDGNECYCAPEEADVTPQPEPKCHSPGNCECPNNDATLATYDCPADAGLKCSNGGDNRGLFNNFLRTGKEECEECGPIDGCQLNRPLYGKYYECKCHTCMPQYVPCPFDEVCGRTNGKTGEANMRIIARVLSTDQNSCSLCPHGDPDTDGCSLWGTTYGSDAYVLGVEGTLINAQSTAVPLVTNGVTPFRENPSHNLTRSPYHNIFFESCRSVLMPRLLQGVGLRCENRNCVHEVHDAHPHRMDRSSGLRRAWMGLRGW